MTLNDHVEEFLTRGYTRIPVGVHLISPAFFDDANKAMKIFTERYQNLASTFVRDGENQPEMFLVRRETTDVKYFLHYSNDLLSHGDFVSLRRKLPNDEAYHFGMLGKVHIALNRLSRQILDVLITKGVVEASLRDSFQESVQKGIPYGTTTTRYLWYPAVENQNGARGHFDRSLFTLHCGDVGGTLRGHANLNGLSGFDLSPESGNILLFAGVKMLYATDGNVLPLWHSSTASTKTERQALVHFVHADVGLIVRDAQSAYENFCRTRNLDQEEFYQSGMSVQH